MREKALTKYRRFVDAFCFLRLLSSYLPFVFGQIFVLLFSQNIFALKLSNIYNLKTLKKVNL